MDALWISLVVMWFVLLVAISLAVLIGTVIFWMFHRDDFELDWPHAWMHNKYIRGRYRRMIPAQLLVWWLVVFLWVVSCSVPV